MEQLEVSGLVKTLGDPASPAASAVLRGVSLSLAAGECVGLKGATGSGKSTLLRIIAGLLAPDAGEVRLDGELLSSPNQVRVPPAHRGVGLVFQNLGLWPHLTVGGHLDFVLSASPLPFTRAERVRQREDLLETFLLADLGARYPAELSGGERHLLALARSLAGRPRVLLLDEPFNGLDGALKRRVLVTLNGVRRRLELTSLLVTHNEDEMKMLCQRVEQISEGRMVVHSGASC